LYIAFIIVEVIHIFEKKIAQLTVLAVFMMIIDLSRNYGTQTLAIAIRSFALGEYHKGTRRESFF
jgi:Mg/Co/Ni transporter MgtE